MIPHITPGCRHGFGKAVLSFVNFPGSLNTARIWFTSNIPLNVFAFIFPWKVYTAGFWIKRIHPEAQRPESAGL
jgi:hypothetical protein